MVSKSCKKSSVLIKWKTRDQRFDKEQATPLDTIDLAYGLLEKGQPIKAKII